MTSHIKVSGAWKQLSGVSVKVSGAWKSAAGLYVKVGGVWKEVFAPAGGGGPTSWTFNVSSIWASASGHTGTQSAGSGGLADGAYTANASYWGSQNGTGEYIRADFGADVYVTNVKLRGTDASGWGYIYTRGLLQRSLDGSTWTTITTISGAPADYSLATYAVNATCRYIRLTYDGYLAVGDFWFE